jgi:hypothetical protein
MQTGSFFASLEWGWRTGQKSTRITERVSADRMRIVEQTPNPDGSVMEDKGEMTRTGKQSALGKP